MAMMAGLGSASIRRLHRTWEAVGKPFDELYKEMDAILESKVCTVAINAVNNCMQYFRGAKVNHHRVYSIPGEASLGYK